MNILIIEDSECDAQIIANALESQGWMTWHAKNLEEAMISVEAVRFDRITLDYEFSQNVNGFKLWDKLRDAISGGFKLTKAVIISGKALTDDERFQAQNMGITRSFTKPFNARELIEAVRA